MVQLLTVLTLICGALLTVYTASGFILTMIYLLTRRQQITTQNALTHYPTVTIQLPIYNEQYVVERLLDAVSKIDYPTNKLTIQLLDDSTDATTRIAARKIAQLRQQGVHIHHIRRSNRTGYKAGALRVGMEQSVTDLYAIFDADFIPPPDFLLRTLPHFIDNPRLGLVQGRWGHLNSYENALTAAQTLAIDAHFIIEQTARTRANLLLSFNGTGGVWHAECIQQSGGWQSDTLTEDLDLSYRAQLNGWKLATVSELVVPGELPPHLAAFRQQQSRWAKGSTQCLRRTIRPLWLSKNLPLHKKVMATLHLCQYMPYPTLLMLTLLTPLMMLTANFNDLPLGFLTFSGIVPPLMYFVSQITSHADWHKRLLGFPALIVYGTGISLSNTVSVIGVLLGFSDEFRRTPKHGTHTAAAYALNPVPLITAAELFMTCYAMWGTAVAWTHYPAAAPYLALSAISYGIVAFTALRDHIRSHRLPQHPTPHRDAP